MQREGRHFATIMPIVLTALVLALGVALWIDISAAPARRAAWIADCVQRDLTALQWDLLYREARPQDDDVAIAVGLGVAAMELAVSRR